MLKITRERDSGLLLERCCFCRAPTPFWVGNGEVACCEVCARRAHPDDVPSKKEWILRERIADHTIRDEEWCSTGRDR